MTLKKPVISEQFQKFKNKFSGGTPVIGVTEYQKFKNNIIEKEKPPTISKVKAVGDKLDKKLDTLKINYGMSEEATDDIVAQRVKARIEAEEAIAREKAAAEAAKQKKIKANLITEAEIKSGKIKRRYRGRGRKRRYYFTLAGISLNPIENYTYRQQRKLKSASAKRAEVVEAVNIYNEAVKQGIAELETKGKKRRIKILDKDKFNKLIKKMNDKDSPKTKKASKGTKEATVNQIKN